MTTQESYYMNIPATVWDSDLKPNAKLCYGHITVLANKHGYAYATNSYFAKVLDCSKTTASRYISDLEKLGVIKTKIILKKDSKQVEQRKIYLTQAMGIAQNDNGPIDQNDNGAIAQNDKGNTTSNNTTSNNILDDDIKGKIFFRIVDAYPANRIGNRQHGLKKFKQLDIEEAKLAAVNLKRYLAITGQYTKSLQNYIDQKCFSEDWLKAEEKTKRNKTNTTINNADSFTNKNKSFYD